MRCFIVGVATALSLSIATSAKPVAAEDCFRALTLDSFALSSDTSINLAVLRTIDEARWEESKTNAGWIASLKRMGLEIGSDANFSRFDAERSRVLKLWSYQYNYDQSVRYVSQQLSDNARIAYVSCLKIKAFQEAGLHIIANEVTDSSVQVDVFLNIPSGIDSAKLEIQAVTASNDEKLAAQSALDKLTKDGNVGFLFTRNPSEDFTLVVNSYDGFNATSSINVVPTPVFETPPPRESRVYSFCMGANIHDCGADLFATCQDAWSGLEAAKKDEFCRNNFGGTSYVSLVGQRTTAGGDACGYVRHAFKCLTPYSN
ncbi:MAG: hypothetical protein AAGA75_17340 [Cyanobacteria bacterium P01_E01_bin.6]